MLLNLFTLAHYLGLGRGIHSYALFDRPRGQATGIRKVENGINFKFYGGKILTLTSPVGAGNR